MRSSNLDFNYIALLTSLWTSARVMMRNFFLFKYCRIFICIIFAATGSLNSDGADFEREILLILWEALVVVGSFLGETWTCLGLVWVGLCVRDDDMVNSQNSIKSPARVAIGSRPLEGQGRGDGS